jgi:hypothetical protein
MNILYEWMDKISSKAKLFLVWRIDLVTLPFLDLDSVFLYFRSYMCFQISFCLLTCPPLPLPLAINIYKKLFWTGFDMFSNNFRRIGHLINWLQTYCLPPPPHTVIEPLFFFLKSGLYMGQSSNDICLLKVKLSFFI